MTNTSAPATIRPTLIPTDEPTTEPLDPVSGRGASLTGASSTKVVKLIPYTVSIDVKLANLLSAGETPRESNIPGPLDAEESGNPRIKT